MRDTVKRWLPLVCWVVLIFALSSVPDVTPGDIRFPRGTDKVVHFTEYAVLAVLFYRGLSYGRERSGRRMFWVTVATAAVVGVLDELYQSYVPGRDSSLMDLAADLLGIVTGSFLFMLRDIRKTGRR